MKLSQNGKQKNYIYTNIQNMIWGKKNQLNLLTSQKALMENLADSHVSFLLLSLKEFYLLKTDKQNSSQQPSIPALHLL